MRQSRPNWKWALAMAAVLPAAWSARGQMAITNGAAVNVTPGSFSVVATVVPSLPASAIITVSVFADPAGTTNLAGQVGVELYPLNSGALNTSNDYQRLQSMASLQRQSMALGLLHARISECLPNTTYYYKIKVSNNGQSAVWPSNTLASVTTARENAFAAQSSQLLVTLNEANASGSILTLSNTNTATVLAAVVGDGAASNQAFFSISDLIAASGNTNYAPLGNQTFDAILLGSSGGSFAQNYSLFFSTNFLVSQTAQFSVGQLSAIVAMGQDAQRAGGSGQVPITVNSTAALVGCSFVINVPTNLFTSFSVQSDSALVASATVRAVSANALLFSFQTVGGQNLKGSAQIAHLNYTLATNDASAFVTLLPQTLLGTNSDFSSPSMYGQAGRIILVGRQPLLDTAINGGNRELILYGIAGDSYQIQSSTNLRSATNWINLLRVPLTNLSETISNLDPSPQAIFYRAYDFTANPPLVDIAVPGGGGPSLTLYGAPGSNYTLQVSTDLTATVAWQPLLTYTLTNAFRVFTNLGSASPAFYRIKKE